MAFGSLLLLLDDIASVLDDVALLTKTAAAKTAGVLGDDLALNAQQLSGLAAEREWPVVWKVARGSLRNKAILVPLALLLSALAPLLVAPLLMLGGLYLCLEGVEKIAHRWWPGPPAADPKQQLDADLAALEGSRIQGAIRTDFVLSAEIIVIALGSVAGTPWLTQLLVLVGVALLMTVGVYGFVAAIVKIDDLGLWLTQRPGAASRRFGLLLLQAAPRLMKALTWVGTAAMFLVGGGILLHGLHTLQEAVLQALLPLGSALQGLGLALAGGVLGIAAGALALLLMRGVQRLRRG